MSRRFFDDWDDSMHAGRHAPPFSERDRHPAHANDRGGHLIAYRASSSLFGRRFYLAFFMGAERRSAERLKQEGQVQSFIGLIFYLIGLAWLIFWITVIVIGLGVIGAYLLKSAAGIDLFEGPSVFHYWFFD